MVGRSSEKSEVEESRKKAREEEDEEEEGDAGSAHYEPEAAVASALRLQMYLENPDELGHST